MTKYILEVTNLTKDYGSLAGGFRAVDHVSFGVSEGEVLGLLGPNGAGKTTTIQMLLGLTLPTEGIIEYGGQNFAHHREEILNTMNFVSADNQMQGRVTVRQSLHVFARMYGVASWMRKIETLATMLGVFDKLDTPYWYLSSGEKARANLVRGFLNNPKIILMDEPTASLDPEIVQTVLEFISDMQKKEKLAILYTSHNMVEVARVCDRVAFLDHGRIVALDTPLGLTKRVGTATLEITFDGEEKPVVEYLGSLHYKYSPIRPHVIAIRLPESDIPKALFGLKKQGIWLTDIEIKKPDLEDVFLAIAKGGVDALATS